MEQQTTPMPASTNSLISAKECRYTVAGEEVKLSFDIVRKYLVRGNASVTDQEIVLFINVCKFNQLNPFLNEAYLIKFGKDAAQMIVSKEAYFKRAEACPEYDGFRSGIIVMRDNKAVELDGCFKIKGDVLVGGWAEVYRRDRKYPVIAKVNLDEYDKGQSIWNSKKATMISKIAKVQAFREAFPAQLGAMYTSEETSVEEVPYSEVKEEANSKLITLTESGKPEVVDTETGEVKESEATPQPTTTPQVMTAKMPGF
jgi:phage recombination protein Bet|nr:MAG TPA_asm: RecT protein [Caudoviricetes sp.]